MTLDFGQIAIGRRQYRTIVRWSGIYDIAVTAPFVTPWTYRLLLDLFTWGHESLGLTGALPNDDTYTVLYANLLGSVVVVWSMFRIRHPSVRLGRYDGVARFLFSSWQIAALSGGASTIVLVFLIPEVVWGLVQWWPVQSATKKDSARGC